MSWDEEYDIVCAGSGMGGLTGALTATERGKTAIVVEKFEQLGGVSALSSGQLWPGPNHLAEAAGIKDDEGSAKSYINHLSQGMSSPELRAAFFTGSREALRFMTDAIGIEMRVIRNLPDYYYPKVPGSAAEGRYIEVVPFPAQKLGDWASKVLCSPYGHYYNYSTSSEWIDMQHGGDHLSVPLKRHAAADERCAGAGMAAAQVFAALKRGVEFRTSTEVTQLVIEDEKIVGVVIRGPSGTRRIRARCGVLLATGGYDWHPTFVRSFDALPSTGSMALPTVTGDHFILASKAGVIPIPARAPAQTPIFVGYKVPSETIYGKKGSSRLLVPGQPHSIVVNRTGKRFANDSFYPDVATKCGRFDGQEEGMANWPAWVIFDQNMLDKKGMLPAPPGSPLPDGMAIQADDLSVLARLAGIDVEGLQTTVERFNEMCKTGVDKDFERGTNLWGRLMAGDPKLKNPNMAELQKAPFYAIKLERVTMGVPTAGLPINGDGCVTDAAGDVVPGLYASGNSASWQDWGGGYNSGIASMRGMLYGYRSALHMTS
jgi:3-oxosteroid 1-dehydrogenase